MGGEILTVMVVACIVLLIWALAAQSDRARMARRMKRMEESQARAKARFDRERKSKRGRRW